jgi:hypothetical protein
MTRPAERHFRPELFAWLRAVGGRIVFHADDRCLRDIDREWVGPTGVYTAMGDDGDHNGGEEREEADTK